MLVNSSNLKFRQIREVSAAEVTQMWSEDIEKYLRKAEKATDQDNSSDSGNDSDSSNASDNEID